MGIQYFFIFLLFFCCFTAARVYSDTLSKSELQLRNETENIITIFESPEQVNKQNAKEILIGNAGITIKLIDTDEPPGNVAIYFERDMCLPDDNLNEICPIESPRSDLFTSADTSGISDEIILKGGASLTSDDKHFDTSAATSDFPQLEKYISDNNLKVISSSSSKDNQSYMSAVSTPHSSQCGIYISHDSVEGSSSLTGNDKSYTSAVSSGFNEGGKHISEDNFRDDATLNSEDKRSYDSVDSKGVSQEGSHTSDDNSSLTGDDNQSYKSADPKEVFKKENHVSDENLKDSSSLIGDDEQSFELVVAKVFSEERKYNSDDNSKDSASVNTNAQHPYRLAELIDISQQQDHISQGNLKVNSSLTIDYKLNNKVDDGVEEKLETKVHLESPDTNSNSYVSSSSEFDKSSSKSVSTNLYSHPHDNIDCEYGSNFNSNYSSEMYCGSHNRTVSDDCDMGFNHVQKSFLTDCLISDIIPDRISEATGIKDMFYGPVEESDKNKIKCNKKDPVISNKETAGGIDKEIIAKQVKKSLKPIKKLLYSVLSKVKSHDDPMLLELLTINSVIETSMNDIRNEILQLQQLLEARAPSKLMELKNLRGSSTAKVNFLSGKLKT